MVRMSPHAATTFYDSDASALVVRRQAAVRRHDATTAGAHDMDAQGVAEE
jgi:hypothetical protein